MYNLTEEDKEFLKTYQPGDYEKPSVTADIVVFTYNSLFNELKVLLIKRKNPPFKDKWAIPGGFVEMDETTYQAALREIREETNVIPTELELIGVYSDVKRDPRMRVISIAYLTFIEDESVVQAGDDAKEFKFFDVDNLPELAFDHDKILKDAIEKIS